MSASTPRNGATPVYDIDAEEAVIASLMVDAEAINKAREFLKTGPPRAEADAMWRLIGLSQVRLRQYAPGTKTLQDLIKRTPKYERDATVVGALATALKATRP